MIPKGLFSQIIMIGLAIAIAVTYIQPTFTEIAAVQDNITLYQTERQKVSEVNAQLASLTAQLESIPALDQRRLLIYIPDYVDTIAVPRVIQNIARESGVILKQVAYAGVQESYLDRLGTSADVYPVPHAFTLNVDGTYGQIKNLLRLMEQNDFPLEVHSLSISMLDGGFLSADMQLITYSQNLPAESPFDN